jgi:hypothetical protein
MLLLDYFDAFDRSSSMIFAPGKAENQNQMQNHYGLVHLTFPRRPAEKENSQDRDRGCLKVLSVPPPGADGLPFIPSSLKSSQKTTQTDDAEAITQSLLRIRPAGNKVQTRRPL